MDCMEVKNTMGLPLKNCPIKVTTHRFGVNPVQSSEADPDRPIAMKQMCNIGGFYHYCINEEDI